MKKKSLLVFFMILLTVSLSLCAAAVTLEYKEFTSDSTFKPVSYSAHKSVSTVTLYGNADYLCMKSVKDTKESQEFRLEVYSDSKRKKKILEYANDYKKGTKYDDILFDLTELKSKTYYATSYVIKRKNTPYSEYEKDPSTVTKFKIVVKRDGTSIKKMKAIMYGYENSPEGPIVYWYSVPGATKYDIYKKTDGKFKKIKTVKASGGDMSYYIDKTLKDKNATAYYKVKAVNGTGSTTLSEDELKVNAVKTPKVTLEYNAKGGIKVSWSKVADKATYHVYMATANSDWVHVNKTSKRSYVHKENDMVNGSYMQSGTVYFFTVVAETSKGTSGYENDAAVLYFKNPEIKSVKEDSGKLTLSWNAVKSVESYNIYRRPDGNGEWIKIGSTRNTDFTDSTVEKNVMYNYCVKSVISSYECIYSAVQKSNAVVDAPVITSVKANGQGYPVIIWNKIDGVSFHVLRKGEGEEIWSEVGRTNGTSFTDKNRIENGKKYSYKVCASVYSVYGNRSDNVSSATEPIVCYLSVKNPKSMPLRDGVEISWDRVENVDGYNVYRKDSEGEYNLLEKTEKNNYADKTLVKDVNYTYKVICVVDGEEKSITAAEFSVKLSSRYVNVLTETANTDEDWFCGIKPDGYDSKTKYTVYTKINDTWELVKEQRIRNGELYFRKNKGSLVNVYSVASVSPDGTVTSYGDENAFTLSYIVPTEITATPDHQSYTATLKWDPIEGAEKYIVYTYGTQLAVLDGTKTSYKTGKLTPDSYHYFSVSVVRGDTEYHSDTCNVYIIKKPTVKAEIANKGIELSWDGYTGTLYTVYRKDTADGEWKALKSLMSTLYTDTSAKNGDTYYYTVQPEGGAKNEKGVKVTFIKPVKISSITLSKKSVELKWEKSSAADYYIVQKKTDGKWKEIYRTKDAKTVKYTDKKVKAGKKYYYRVCVVKDGEKSKYTLKTVTFVAPPAGFKAAAVSGGVKLTFNNVSGAKKYVIYRKSGNGKFKKLKTLKSSTRNYTDKSVKKGVKYTYYVKAYNGSEYSVASSKVAYKKK